MSASRYVRRSWEGAEDGAAIRAMLRDRYRVLGPPAYPTASDFDFWLSTSTNQAVPEEISLWFDGDRVVGFVWPAANQVDFFVHPEAADVEAELFAWAEARLMAAPPEDGVLSAACIGGNVQREALLAATGYARTEDFVACHVRAVGEPLPTVPPLPEGYTVRALRGPHEVAERVAAHRAAFPDWKITPEGYLRAMQTATYRLDLDIVATTPADEIVASALVWYDGSLRMGLFEPIGCHPDYQKRGLASGCIREGLRRLAAIGAETAIVCGWRDDSDGSRLYRKLGFHEAERLYTWKRTLASPHEGSEDSANAQSPRSE